MLKSSAPPTAPQPTEVTANGKESPRNGTTHEQSAPRPAAVDVSEAPAVPTLAGSNGPLTPSDGVGEVLASFQETMRRWLAVQEKFLSVQEQVLSSAFQRQAAPRSADVAPVPAAAPPRALRVPPAPVLPVLKPTEAPALMASATAGLAPVINRVSPSAVVPAAPAPAPEASPSPSEEANGIPTTPEFQQDLLTAVVDRTCYPQDMLDLDVPLEAGLGIDSIKRIEILTSLKRYNTVFVNVERSEEEALSAFARLKTLRDIIDTYDQARERYLAPAQPNGEAEPALKSLPQPVPDAQPEVLKNNDVAPRPEVNRINPPELRPRPPEPAPPRAPSVLRRYVVKATEIPVGAEPDWERPMPSDRALLILGKMLGPQQMLEGIEQASQHPVLQVVPGRETRQLTPNRFEADFSSPEFVAELRRLVRQTTSLPLGAVLDLLPLSEGFDESTALDPAAALTLSQWSCNFLRVFAPDLSRNEGTDPCKVFHFTSMGGKFGLGADRPLPLAQAGTLGVFKTFAREYPKVRVKNVDLDLQTDPAFLFNRVLAELASEDDLLEVGVNQFGRWKLELRDGALGGEEPALKLGPDSVILITGGGYGITAELARATALAWGPKLILVGRSPLPGEEPEELRTLSDDRALRQHFIDKARSSGVPAVPHELEKEVRRVLKERRVRTTLRELRPMCPALEYHALDVRDAEAFGQLIERVYQTWGRIDGVIHGAGVIEDQRLADKDPESFARVFSTKVQSAAVLARKLRPEGLKFLALLSSVAGRFGNSGQVDYSAANEYLNKLAGHLNRQWPGRVTALNWGPWDGGMVTPGLRKVFESEGVGLIPLAEGSLFLVQELSAA
ncbi:MAG TPA: SDR family NAD(P)-dependent oxidoreductase, partial [Gemmataceae bacterium]|nr:SDR family NAD(P)-dependent oxidoreductase [Gemmataceae bacterium]